MIISNSTPLINFSSVGGLELLHALFGEISVPEAVWDETVGQSHKYPSALAIQQCDWIHKIAITNYQLRDVFLLELDRGEAEAITLALEQHAELVLIDERSGREVAERVGLNFTGTIGCLSRAKKLGVISDIRSRLDKIMQEAGFWVSPRFYEKILKDHGEA